MIIDIPKRNPFFQTNIGDTTGSIWSSRNLDLKFNEGKVRPTERVLVTSNSSTADNPQGLPVAFAKLNGNVGGLSTTRYWTIAGTEVYQTAGTSGDFEEDDASGRPTDLDSAKSDMAVFNNRLYIASDNKLYRLTTGTSWTLVS